MSENMDTDIIDFLDQLNFVLSNDFVERWKFRYSTKFIRHFQFRVLSNLNKQKPLKKTVLHNYLTKRCKYSPDQVTNFFDAINLEFLYPLIMDR